MRRPRTLGTDPDCNFNTATPDAMVAAGKANVSTFTTPANTNYVRFQTFAADASASAHDLDMFVYRAAPGVEHVRAARDERWAGRERVRGSTSTLLTTAGHAVQGVHPRLQRGRTGRELRAQLVGAHLALEQPVHDRSGLPDGRVGDVIPTTFGWTGLPAGNRYLGRVQTVDPAAPTVAMSTTLVFVNTR